MILSKTSCNVKNSISSEPSIFEWVVTIAMVLCAVVAAFL